MFNRGCWLLKALQLEFQKDRAEFMMQPPNVLHVASVSPAHACRVGVCMIRNFALKVVS